MDGKFLLEQARLIENEIIDIRRKIHQNPELGFQEVETARYISGYLKGLGLEVQEGVGNTGVVALLRGDLTSANSKTIAVRADMDALPVMEETEVSYASTKKGIMHACGHDAHVGMTLGLAKILTQFKDKLAGNVKFIFQPCEERPPGGAIEMIKEGVLENPKVDAIIGMHVNPIVTSGFIGFKEGVLMAATDEFILTIKGKGGHGAAPHHTIDTVVLGAQIIQALQTIPSRRVDPVEPMVLTIGMVKAGVAPNVIADTMVLEGTVRTLDPNLREETPKLMRQVIGGIVAGAGGTYELKYEFGYPALYNNKQMVNLVKRAAQEVAGEGKAILVKNPSMGGEDFAYFAEKIPACYWFLGVGHKDRENYPWHHPKFDLDESKLALGTAILAKAVVKYLEEGGETSC